jgi:polysaccharide biosynthesis transport protein
MTDFLPAPVSTASSGEADLDLRSVLTILWARKAIIMSVVAAVTLITGLMLLQQPSQYTASTTLMLDTRKTQVVDFESVVSGLTVDEAAVQSEIAILSSRKLAYRVVDVLGLQNDPEFTVMILAKRLCSACWHGWASTAKNRLRRIIQSPKW